MATHFQAIAIATLLLLCTACGSLPLVTYTPAEVQTPDNLYTVLKYPDKTISQLQRQLTDYKSRCGLAAGVTNYTLQFEPLTDSESVMFVTIVDGVSTVIKAQEYSNVVTLTVWTRNWRNAEYIINAVEGGACIDSAWDSRLKERKEGR